MKAPPLLLYLKENAAAHAHWEGYSGGRIRSTNNWFSKSLIVFFFVFFEDYES
jgi:hypothetical protein